MSLATAHSTQTELLDLLTQICETPAPTFKEQKRAALIAGFFEQAGLKPQTDEVGNVIARVAGGTGERILLAAHLDTVFSEDIIKVSSKDGKLTAPGIGDNSASLAILIHYLNHLPEKRPRLVVAATVGEEGIGDLYGMRELMRAYKHEVDKVIAVDGHLGTVVDQAVGSKRFEVSIHAKGGHSWGDFPSPSATHTLADMVHALTRMNVPREPRSSFNIGQLSGGTSINAIAQEARFNLDLRSLDPKVLGELERETKSRLLKVGRQHGVSYDLQQIGERPAAKSDNHELVTKAKEVLNELGITARTAASSTDANIPMSLGIPAIAFGVYKGGDAHRLSEWLAPDSLSTGCKALKSLLERLA